MRLTKKNIDEVMEKYLTSKDGLVQIKHGEVDAAINELSSEFVGHIGTSRETNDFGREFLIIYSVGQKSSRKIAEYIVG